MAPDSPGTVIPLWDIIASAAEGHADWKMITSIATVSPPAKGTVAYKFPGGFAKPSRVTNYGIDAQGTIFAVGVRAPSISVESCQISNNGQDGVVIGGFVGGLFPIIVVSASTITDNGGWGLKGLASPVGNLIFSRENNTIVGNASGSIEFIQSLPPL